MHARIEQGQSWFSRGTRVCCSPSVIVQWICFRVSAFVKSLMGNRAASHAEPLPIRLEGRVQPPKRAFPEKLVNEILEHMSEEPQRQEDLKCNLRVVNPRLVRICFNAAGHCFDQAGRTSQRCVAKKEAWSTIGRAFVMCCAEDPCGFSAQVEGQQRVVTYDEVLSSVLRDDGQFMPICVSEQEKNTKGFIVLAIRGVDLARDTKRERPHFTRCEYRGFYVTC